MALCIRRVGKIAHLMIEEEWWRVSGDDTVKKRAKWSKGHLNMSAWFLVVIVVLIRYTHTHTLTYRNSTNSAWIYICLLSFVNGWLGENYWTIFFIIECVILFPFSWNLHEWSWNDFQRLMCACFDCLYFWECEDRGVFQSKCKILSVCPVNMVMPTSHLYPFKLKNEHQTVYTICCPGVWINLWNDNIVGGSNCICGVEGEWIINECA